MLYSVAMTKDCDVLTDVNFNVKDHDVNIIQSINIYGNIKLHTVSCTLKLLAVIR